MKYDQHIDEEPTMVCEPMKALRTSDGCTESICDVAMHIEDKVDELPSDILRMALECALDDMEKGRTIPHGKLMDIVEKEMGWK